MKAVNMRRCRVFCWAFSLLATRLVLAQERPATQEPPPDAPPTAEQDAVPTEKNGGPNEHTQPQASDSASPTSESAPSRDSTPPPAASAAPRPSSGESDWAQPTPLPTIAKPTTPPSTSDPAADSAFNGTTAEGPSTSVNDTSMNVSAVDVVVTGKRSRTLELPGSVDVIGEEEISKEVTSNALDLMRKIPGFAYQDYGNGGVPNGFMLRGFSSNHGNDTLVVIDGVPINEHSWNGQDDGAPDLNQLSSDEIERIEVIKGPLDARFGNWGRSGTVLIQTRRRGDFWKADVSRGTFRTQKAYVSFGTEHFDGKFNQVYSVESFETSGWRQNSEQQRQNAYGKWFYRPTKQLQLGLMTHFYRASWSTGSYIDERQWQSNPQRAFSGAANDGGYKRLAEVALHADTKVAGLLPVNAILWYRSSNSSRYADWTYEGVGQTEDHGEVKVIGGLVNMESDWTVANQQTLKVDGGFDFRRFDTNGENWTSDARVRQALNADDRWLFQNGGVYLKSSYDIAKRVRLSAGVREDLFWGSHTDRVVDDKSKMKTYSVPTYKAGIVGDILENLSLYGNIGTTFRLPNQAAKYEHPAPSVEGLLSWETGAKASAFDLVTLRYAYFQSTERQTRLEQGIYVDDGKARRAGQEIELLAGPLHSVELFTALTVHDGHYVGGTNDGNLVPTVPRYIWKVGVQGEAPWGTGGRVNFNDVGKWKTDPENTHSYAGYRVVDLGIYQTVARDWSLALDVKNLLDEKYSEFVGFWSGSNQYMPSNPRSVFATVRFNKE